MANEEHLIRYLAESLVSNPDEIRIHQRETGRTTVIELNVAPDDMGRIIGKNGRVANAMRTLLSAMSDNENRGRRIILEIE